MIKNVGHLEAYYWVARTRSFHEAAERLGLTQPAISSRIKELEDSLGVRLFNRSTRTVTCTDHGIEIFEYAERILSLTHVLEDRVLHRGILRGLLHLGVPDSFAVLCLPNFLRYIRETHPQINVAIAVENSRALVRQLSDGLLDMAIIAQPENVEHFTTIPLGLHELSWVSSPGTKIRSGTLHPSDLVKWTIITHPAPSNLFSSLMEWFGSEDLCPSRILTCNSMAVIVSLASSDLGIAMLPTCLIAEEVKRDCLRILTVSPPIPPQSVFLAYQKGSLASSARVILGAIKRAVCGTQFLR